MGALQTSSGAGIYIAVISSEVRGTLLFVERPRCNLCVIILCKMEWLFGLQDKS